jgi:crotonobetainyl-CoA:carnitine CoA-transferase CaiB-like acyl-CoA transferase
LLDEALSARTTDEWLAAFGGRVPAAPIYDVQQALENPFVAAQNMIQTLTHADGSDFRMIDSPFRTGEPTPNHPAPALGADTEALLHELGMSDGDIAALREKKIV